MKRMAAIFLMLTVLIASIGVSVNTHICKKEGVIKSFFVKYGECVCDTDREVPSASCCHQITIEKPEKKAVVKMKQNFFN